MGQTLAREFAARDDVTLVALVDSNAPSELFGALHARTLEDVDARRIDVVVDFSSPEGVTTSATWCAAHDVALVVGVSSLRDAQREALRRAAERVCVVVAANFSVGAVLAQRFAAAAAPYYERVEIIELHHDRKVDAPSATAVATARAIAQARRRAQRPALDDPTTSRTYGDARGADVEDGVRVHAVRLPGLVAHEEILFASPGEGLTIRHDSHDRTSFVPGVVAAALYAHGNGPQLVEGIDELI